MNRVVALALPLALFAGAASAHTSAAWSPPVFNPVLSSPYEDGGRMSFSFDGRTFYFNVYNHPAVYG